MYSIGIHSDTYLGHSLEEAVSGASNAGFSLMEFSASAKTGFLSWEMSEADIDKLDKLLDDNDVDIESISTEVDLLSDSGVIDITRSAGLAARLGVDFLVVSIIPDSMRALSASDKTYLQQRLAAALVACREREVMLAVLTGGKNFPTGETLENFLAFDLGQDLGICHDAGACLVYSDVKPEEDLRRARRILTVRITDMVPGASGRVCLPLGEGKVDFQEVFLRYGARSCPGPLVVEIRNHGEPPLPLATINKNVVKSYKYLKRLLGTQFPD